MISQHKVERTLITSYSNVMKLTTCEEFVCYFYSIRLTIALKNLFCDVAPKLIISLLNSDCVVIHIHICFLTV